MSQHATARRVATGTGATLALAVVGVTATGGAAHADDAYTVRQGDTVSHIATRTGTTVAAIARANSLADASRIRIGQVLSIPSGSAPAAAPAAPAPAPAPAPASGSYTVASGDTVSHIAAKLGTSVQAIVSANGLDARAFIRVGQTLTVPGSTAAAAAAAPAPAAVAQATGSVSHTVRSGETVTAIAAKHGATVAAVIAANGLDARALIRIGQTLTVPVPAAAPAAAAVGNTFAGRTYSDSVVAAANANLATLRSTGTPSKADMQAKIAATARAMGVDPALAQAIAFQESGFNHGVVSPANAIGAMQVIPTSGQWASDLVGRQLNLVNPDDNVTAGVAILRALVSNAPDVPTAIAGYYQGAASVKKNGMFADTRRYVANVQTHMTRFR
ncbi:LysM peptidoglycan-binding domain-containing protein [Cellulomonas sp.]|uniref:LysM peptidoglycan-binding domain-containing protein n=1 Tax=Cellulomonas sp. TaxID=40001 RepID=UPI003BAD4B9B